MVVVASGRAERRQVEGAELLLVHARVGAGREEQHDLARRRLARVDQVAHAPRDVLGLGLAPVDAGLRVALLVGHEQLDRGPERRVGEAPGRLERLEAVAEVGREEVVDHVEHLGARAVVLRQREHAADLLAALAEDLDVRVPEAVDRLELVADEEDLGVLLGEQVDQLALQPVRVLELVDHDRAEPKLLACTNAAVVAEEVARSELEVFEIERRLAILGFLILGLAALLGGAFLFAAINAPKPAAQATSPSPTSSATGLGTASPTESGSPSGSGSGTPSPASIMHLPTVARKPASSTARKTSPV